MVRDCIGLLLTAACGSAVRISAHVITASAQSYARRSSARHARGSSVHMADPAVQSASRLLAQLIASANNNDTRSVQLKTFAFGATGSHTIIVEGTELTQYMKLPVEEYVLYDVQYMQRLTNDTFELRLPVATVATGRNPGVMASPWLRVRVVPGGDGSTLSIKSVGANLLGFNENGTRLESSSNATPALTNLERALRSITANFSALLAWDSGSRNVWAARSESTRLKATVRMDFGVSISTPLPRLLVQGAVNIIIKSAMRIALPQFLTLLQRDFERWRNGTREIGTSVGSLLEMDPLEVEEVVLDEPGPPGPGSRNA